MRRLILGDGMLGSELIKQTGWDYISRKKDGIDFTDYYSYRDLISEYDEIINCIGYVNTYDVLKDNHWNVNYKGVTDLTDLCNLFNKKLIHISSDYVYGYSVTNASEDDIPVHCRNWYSYTKLLSDGYVQLRSDNYLLIRTSFKERPCKHAKGWMIRGNFDYVDVIVDKLKNIIQLNASGVYNVGTETKTLFDLGKQTNENIKPTTKYIDDSVPDDISMNLAKLEDMVHG